MDIISTIVKLAAAVTALGTAGLVIFRASRWVSSRFRTIDNFLADWAGVPARPGHRAIPGMVQRMSDLEAGIDSIQKEVTTNSGHSLKDVVCRIARRVDANDHVIGEHLTWHANAGHLDPTARVDLTRERGEQCHGTRQPG